MTILEKLFKKKDTPLIRYVDLAGSKSFVWQILDDGVRSRRIGILAAGHLMFECVMKPGSTFQKHQHDCKEKVYVMEGCLEMDDVEYTEGMTATIFPYEAHAFYSPKGGRFLVEFEKIYK